MNDKSHVGMFCCPLCKEPMGVLLDRRLKNSLEQFNIIGPELCDKCKQRLKDEDHIILYEAEKTPKGMRLIGKWIEVDLKPFLNDNEKENNFLKENRFGFCEEGFIDYITKGNKND